VGVKPWSTPKLHLKFLWISNLRPQKFAIIFFCLKLFCYNISVGSDDWNTIRAYANWLNDVMYNVLYINNVGHPTVIVPYINTSCNYYWNELRSFTWILWTVILMLTNGPFMYNIRIIIFTNRNNDSLSLYNIHVCVSSSTGQTIYRHYCSAPPTPNGYNILNLKQKNTYFLNHRLGWASKQAFKN